MARQRRRGAQQVTIREVAAEANVSVMTVSRVINGEKNVSAKNLAAVQAAIKHLDYIPNPTARRLAGSVHCRIGMLYNNPSLSFLSEFMLGALSECSASGHQLLVERCGMTVAAEQAAVQKLLQCRIDSIVLPAPLSEAKAVLSAVKKAGIAMVAVAVGEPGVDVATIRIDNYKAAHQLAQHLINLGHRRIGFIKGHPNQTVSNQRLRGFLDSLAQNDLETLPELVEQGYFSYHSGLLASERLLALPIRPTAIFASNDDMAAAAVATANRLGLRVPHDLSVVGFDDTLIASTIWPGLTTIHQPVEAMGRAAIKVVLEEMKRLRNGETGGPAQRKLRYTLVERESTAPPPKLSY